MKKILGMALATVLGLGTLAGCGSSSTTTTTTTDAQATQEAAPAPETVVTTEPEPDRSQLIVGFDAAYPPYGFVDDSGEYVGFDLDLAAEVCERLGWELIKQPIDWAAKDMELNSGAIDVIWNGFTMTGREPFYTFSEPYVDNSIVFVTRAEDGFKTKADLAGTIVMTQTDSSAYTALVENENNTELYESFTALELTPDYNTAFMSLESGAIDAIAVDIGVAQYQLTSRQNDVFTVMDEPLSKEEYAIGFRLGETGLRDQVQNALYEMLADGTFDSIVANYADYNLDQMVSLELPEGNAVATDDTEETALVEDDREIFIVGFDAAYPPYGFVDDSGEYVGFDLDLAAEVCSRRGWELIKQPIDWSAKDMELNSGAIDAIWNGFTMTGREPFYTFSDPYVDNSIVFVTRSEDNLATKADLAGKVVMTQTDSSAYTALVENDDNADLYASLAALELTPDYNTAFMSLESGAIDAIAVDIGVAQYQLTSRQNDVFTMMEEPLSKEEYAVGFRLDDTLLRDQVQETLYEMVDDGTFDSIVANYADYNLDQMISLGR
ncbi:MAG: amino acid ABC transporter substrate-binding protein [Bacillota bacterium]